MTAVVKQLLGADLLECDIPSLIYHRGRRIDFPLSPLNLLRRLGPITCLKAARDFLRARFRMPGNRGDDFASLAVHIYGHEIAGRFLLGYSEKLWGLPCDRLSPSIAGKRLKGLNLSTFVVETLLGRKAKTRHLDGQFLYPRSGFGAIGERLADSAGRENISTDSPVTGIRHDQARILAIEINGYQCVPVREVVSTLPLPLFMRLLDPQPPAPLLAKASALRFRNVILVGLFVNRSRVTHSGSIYFPDPEFPMTRVYEPKNRSEAMAPANQTMLVAEIPCFAGDAQWINTDEQLISMVAKSLSGLGWFSSAEILGGCVKRLPAAYPLLEVGTEQNVEELLDYLRGFDNLQVAGRNGLFLYSHTHRMLRFGHDAVAKITSRAQASV